MDLENRLEKLSKNIKLMIGIQILIYSTILIGCYFYAKIKLDKANQPFIDACVPIQAEIDRTNYFLEESSRRFQQECEQRRQERIRILDEERERVLNILDLNFREYQLQSEDFLEQLRTIDREDLPRILDRVTDLEEKERLLKE